VGQWADVWLRDYERPAYSTQRTYRLALKRVREDIGDKALTAIDRPTARGLARKWPNGTTRVARAMFGDAFRDGVILANPFENQRLEQSKGRKDLDALSEAEIRGLADAALGSLNEYGTEFRAVILFSATSAAVLGSSRASGALTWLGTG
jgi:integrase